MSDFLFARSQMAMSLAFHIVFAALGIGMPLLMVMAEGAYLRTGKPVYLELSKRWAKGTAILFAVGAVSGTVLSFELGLLWPGFMEKAGAIIGMPFSLEGFAFFTEAIFIGVYLYGRSLLSPLLHWLAGVVVAVSGILSGIFGSFGALYFGWLSDRLGTKKVMIAGALFCALFAFPFFWLVNTGIPVVIWTAVVIGHLGERTVFGAQPLFYMQLFPVQLRYSGIALSREITGAVAAGPLPLLATALLAALATWAGRISESTALPVPDAGAGASA